MSKINFDHGETWMTAERGGFYTATCLVDRRKVRFAGPAGFCLGDGLWLGQGWTDVAAKPTAVWIMASTRSDLPRVIRVFDHPADWIEEVLALAGAVARVLSPPSDVGLRSSFTNWPRV
jgi:hypothetical protein